MPDWNAVKTDFLATGMSYSALASKWGVSISTLKKKAAREKWAQAHDDVVVLAENLPEEKLAKKPRKKAKRKPKEEPKQEPVPLEVKQEPEPMELVPQNEEIALVSAAAAEIRAKRARRMLETTDMMMDHIIDALQLVEPDNTYALGMLVRALKDLRDIQGLNKSALDIEEQQARIAKLRSETRIVEEDSQGGVILLPTPDAALTPPEDA